MSIGIDNGKLNRFNPDRTLSVKVDANGRFELPVMLEKPGIVVVSDEGYAELRPDDIGVDLEITLLPWATIEGIYRIGAEVAENTEVVCSEYPTINNPAPQIGFSAKTRTDDQGRFRFERMPAGRGSVKVYVKQTTRITGNVQLENYLVEAGGTARVELGGRGVLTPRHISKIENLGLGRRRASRLLVSILV